MKLKPGKFYIDSFRRVYGPMQKHPGLGTPYFTCPGHSHRWDANGNVIHGAMWFGHHNNTFDLVRSLSKKQRRKGAA